MPEGQVRMSHTYSLVFMLQVSLPGMWKDKPL